MKIEQPMLHNDLSSHMTWLHLGAPFIIGWTRIKDINLYSSITFESLIDNDEAYRMATPKFYLFISSFFDDV